MNRFGLFTAMTMLAGLLMLSRSVAANGGQVRVANQPIGPYEVTVFTSPVPLQTGTVDVSVLVQRADTKAIVEDAVIVLIVEPAAGGPAQRYPVTREQATNKLYYAAEFPISEPGEYRFSLEIRGPEGAGAIAFTAQVERASATFWRTWWFWAVVGIGAIALLWWIFRSPAPGSAAAATRGTTQSRRR